MYVKNYMSTDLVISRQDTTVIKARCANIHRLPVVVKGQLVGLLTGMLWLPRTRATATSLSVHELNYLSTWRRRRRALWFSKWYTAECPLGTSRFQMLWTSGVLVVMDHAQWVSYHRQGRPSLTSIATTPRDSFRGGKSEDDKIGILEDLGETALPKHNWSITQMNVYHLDDKTNVVVHVDTQDSEEVASSKKKT